MNSWIIYLYLCSAMLLTACYVNELHNTSFTGVVHSQSNMTLCTVTNVLKLIQSSNGIMLWI